jgi:hypothetical protein
MVADQRRLVRQASQKPSTTTSVLNRFNGCKKPTIVEPVYKRVFLEGPYRSRKVDLQWGQSNRCRPAGRLASQMASHARSIQTASDPRSRELCVVGGPVQGSVAGRRRLGHTGQLCCWTHNVNPWQASCNKAVWKTEVKVQL